MQILQIYLATKQLPVLSQLCWSRDTTTPSAGHSLGTEWLSQESGSSGEQRRRVWARGGLRQRLWMGGCLSFMPRVRYLSLYWKPSLHKILYSPHTRRTESSCMLLLFLDNQNVTSIAPCGLLLHLRLSESGAGSLKKNKKWNPRCLWQSHWL